MYLENSTIKTPLGLYIHIPYCKARCPFCDFNAHAHPLEEEHYLQALERDLEEDLCTWGAHLQKNHQLKSIYIGGGTPSLFKPSSIERLLSFTKKLFKHFEIPIGEQIECTMESNPTEQEKFKDFQKAGINRLSLGIQSFDDATLSKMKRGYSKKIAQTALKLASDSGFASLNVDLMYGMRTQTKKEALLDLTLVLDSLITHLSWYPLSIEPNSLWYAQKETTKSDIWCEHLRSQGEAYLLKKNLHRYEISAFSFQGFPCKHNLLYWNYKDFLAIGAGGHGKLTLPFKTIRYHKTRHPNDYLKHFQKNLATEHNLGRRIETIPSSHLDFERLLMGLRLTEGIENTNFQESTLKKLRTFEEKGFITLENERIKPTSFGLQFMNVLWEELLPAKEA